MTLFDQNTDVEDKLGETRAAGSTMRSQLKAAEPQKTDLKTQLDDEELAVTNLECMTSKTEADF